jgi:hypothetical protein
MTASSPPDRVRRSVTARLLALPAAASLGVLGAGCAGPPSLPAPVGADPLPSPRLRVGDRWRYLLINRYNRSTIGEASVEVLAIAPEIRLRVDPGDGRPPFEERYAEAWSVIVEGIFDSLITFETPMPLVPPGARVGTSTRSSTRYRSERSRDVLAWNQQVRATRWERVQVPAGAFDALRIERSVWFKHPDVFRYGSERTDTLWYAPQVGRWVMREWTGDFMSGGPMARAERAREDWVIWQLSAWEPAR